MKLVLHGQPAVVYCPSCKRNVVTNVKGRRSTLLIVAAMLLILVVSYFVLEDLFDDDMVFITVGFAILFCIVAATGGVLFRINDHHLCPLCGRHLGNRGDVVSRQSLPVLLVSSTHHIVFLVRFRLSE
ncbi:hypothetical protein WA577_001156 [Blastocystis sp. JDR]